MNIDEAISQRLGEISRGKTVLDLGGYNGGECHIALQAGAKSAACVDDESWKTYDSWNDFEPFPGVEYIKDNFMDYHKSAQIVILKNVIYHTRNPWMVMEHVRKLTGETLLLATSYVDSQDSVWRVYRPFEGHPVSWTVAWRPSIRGLITLLESTGFTDIEMLVEGDQGSLALQAKPGELPIGYGERI